MLIFFKIKYMNTEVYLGFRLING